MAKGKKNSKKNSKKSGKKNSKKNTQSLPVWNLKDILDPKDINTIIKEMETRAERIAKREKQYKATMSTKLFRQIMQEVEQLSHAASGLGTYAGNWFNENTKDQKATALQSRVEALSAEINNRLLFVEHRFKQFDDKNAKRLIKACPEYAHHLTRVRLARKYTLSDVEEQLITIKDLNGTNALVKLFDIITNAFEYPFGTKKISYSEAQKYFRDPDPKKRRMAFDGIYTVFMANKEVLGELYKHVIDDWRREAERRGYKESISVWNQQMELPDAVVRTLLSACRKNRAVFQAFLKKKGRALGKKLTRYDIYAPVTKSTERFTYTQGCALTLDAFRKFHPQFAVDAARIIDGHIHARPQLNKYTGGYCSYPVPEKTPYILMHWQNDVNSLTTLAHELGHGVHGMLAHKQNIFHHHPILPIAETASTFGELLLADELKKRKPKLARSLTFQQLNGFYATIGRQAYFVLFEIEAHKMVAQHASIDDLAATYMKLQKEQFGDALTIPDQFRWEWLIIPHIYHTPFYCYAYAFGCLLSLALYAQWKKNPAFAERIIAFFAKGGSQDPTKMVKAAGFDLTDEKFWQSGFDVIKRMVKEL